MGIIPVSGLPTMEVIEMKTAYFGNHVMSRWTTLKAE